MATSLFSNPICKVKAISESSSTIRILLYRCRLNDDRKGDDKDEDDEDDDDKDEGIDGDDWFVSSFSVSLTIANM